MLVEAPLKENDSSQSRRQHLENYLFSQIKVGGLRPGDKISTVKLAKQWNISEGTVNQSLHTLAAKGLLVRKPRAGTFVSHESDSESVISQNNPVISLVLPDIKQPEFSYVFQSLQQAANGSPFTVNAVGTEDSIEKYSDILKEQIEAKVSAIALIPPLSGALPVELLIQLYESKIPVITCFRAIEGFGWPLVRVDQMYNTQLAARHLCEIGRKNIGLVSVDIPNSYNDLVKEYAFINTLDEFGLTSKKDLRLVLSGREKRISGNQMWLFNAIETIEHWLKQHPAIDGICCLHDIGAWAVLSALAKTGRRVPEDIALVGNGNMMEFFGFARNDLTTVDCCYEDIGTAILSLVSDIRSGKTIAPNTVVEIQGKLILRHSTLGKGN